MSTVDILLAAFTTVASIAFWFGVAWLSIREAKRREQGGTP